MSSSNTPLLNSPGQATAPPPAPAMSSTNMDANDQQGGATAPVATSTAGKPSQTTRFKSVKIKASLFLQILLVIHPYYYSFYWLCTLGMLIYKGMVFQFNSYVYGLEVAALFPWIFLEVSRLFLGSRGNKMEELPPTTAFLALSLVSFFVYLYYLIWQSYVLLFDLVVGGIAIALLAGELMTGLQLFSNLLVQ